MTLVTTIADPTANSYVTLVEANDYLAVRDGFDLTTWDALSDDQQEWRLVLAANVLDTLRFRGAKASIEQNRAFPRIFPRTEWWSDTKSIFEQSYDAWTDVQTEATAQGYTLPTIPDAVKDAQVEIAFQVIHNHFQSLNPMSAGSAQTNFVGIGKLQVQFGVKKDTITREFLDTASFGAISIVKFYLKPYLASGMAVLG